MISLEGNEMNTNEEEIQKGEYLHYFILQYEMYLLYTS